MVFTRAVSYILTCTDWKRTYLHLVRSLLSLLSSCALLVLLSICTIAGSTAIITALKQHTDTLIEGLEPVDHGDRARNTAEALRFADEFFENGRVQNKTAGFKIRPYHLLQNPKGWADLLHKHDTRILWNYRSNTFKQAVGHYPISFQKSTAAYEGLVLSNRSKENGPKPVIQRIRIDNIRGLSELVRGRMRGEAEVKVALQKLAEARKNTDNNECILPLSYEDLLRDERGAILRAQAYLGLGMDEQLLPLRAKATLDNLCELLENFREVCQAFFGCPELRWMMEDSTNNCRCSTFDSSRLFVSKEFCPGDGTN